MGGQVFSAPPPPSTVCWVESIPPYLLISTALLGVLKGGRLIADRRYPENTALQLKLKE